MIPQQLMVDSDHGIFRGIPNLFIFILLNLKVFNSLFIIEWDDFPAPVNDLPGQMQNTSRLNRGWCFFIAEGHKNTAKTSEISLWSIYLMLSFKQSIFIPVWECVK